MSDFSIEFESQFKVFYMRNHKAVTTKNLRCFPQCSSTGHKDNGFCGNEVIVRWRSNRPAELIAQEKDPKVIFEAFAEFQACASPMTIQSGSILNERDPVSKGLMKGEITFHADTGGTITFSKESKGWHYGWMAGRGNGSQTFHEMRVYLFEKDENSSNLICRASIKSSGFEVTSRKRVRSKKPSSSTSTSTLLPVSTSPTVGKISKKRKGNELPPQPTMYGGGNTRMKPDFSMNSMKMPDPILKTTLEMNNIATLPMVPHSVGGNGGRDPRPNLLQSLFGPNGYSISSTPPIYHPPSTTPPTYQFLFSNPAQHNILSSIPPQADFDNSVLEVLWQPTPPSTINQILNMHSRLRQQQQQQQQQKPPQEQHFFNGGGGVVDDKEKARS